MAMFRALIGIGGGGTLDCSGFQTATITSNTETINCKVGDIIVIIMGRSDTTSSLNADGAIISYYSGFIEGYKITSNSLNWAYTVKATGTSIALSRSGGNATLTIGYAIVTTS